MSEQSITYYDNYTKKLVNCLCYNNFSKKTAKPGNEVIK